MDDEIIEKVMIATSHPMRTDIKTTRLEKLSRRPAYCFVSDNRTDRDDFRTCTSQCVADSGHGKNRPNACHRIARCNNHEFRFANRMENDVWSMSIIGSSVCNGLDVWPAALAHKKFLE